MPSNNFYLGSALSHGCDIHTGSRFNVCGFHSPFASSPRATALILVGVLPISLGLHCLPPTDHIPLSAPGPGWCQWCRRNHRSPGTICESASPHPIGVAADPGNGTPVNGMLGCSLALLGQWLFSSAPNRVGQVCEALLGSMVSKERR